MKYCRKIIVLIALILLFIGNITYAQTSIVSAVAQLTNSAVTVNVTLQNEQGMICAALVDGETTVAVTTKRAEKNNLISFPKGKTGNSVKIFVWESIDKLIPLCNVEVVPVNEIAFYGKKLYVDGDSICFGNGYTGGYGKIIADKYGMELVNNGVGGATLSKGALNSVKYGDKMAWADKKYYLQLTSYDPFADKNTEGFAYEITKEQYENGFGIYPTAYVMENGVLTELDYSEEMPWGRFYIKFDIPTYDNNTVSKYYRMWRFKDAEGNESGNMWLWEAYKTGFESAHKSGNVKIGVARHWLCESIHEIDADADYVILEGGINEYMMDRPIGKLSDEETKELDTTTTIGAMEYICRVISEKHADKKVIFLITPRAKNYTDEINAGYSTSQATWRDYHDAIVSVLKKYNINYVDLFETEFDTAKEEYLFYTRNNDGVHPTKEGYEKFFVPYIEKAMAK